MKKIMILISLFSVIIISCNNTTEEKKDSNDTTSITKIVDENVIKDSIIEEVQENYIENYKYLGDIFNKKDSLYSKFENYINKLNAEISSEKQIEDVISLRDDLLQYASTKTEAYYYSEGEKNQEKWRKVEKELISIGFMPTYTEGMFVQLDKAMILKDAVNKYASEAFKLKMQFNEEYAKSVGGEYPYSGLESEFDAFEKGYKLYSKFNNSKHYKDIKNKFRQMLFDFINIHKVKEMCYARNLNFVDYPWMATCDLPKQFLKRFPDNKFTPIFEKLQNNYSELNPKTPVYLIFVEELKNDEIGKNEDYIDYENRLLDNKFDKLFAYWEKGIDVAHTIRINNFKTEYLVYRFYSDEDKAKEELNKIKELIPSAKIIIANVDNEEHVNVSDKSQE